MNIKNTAFAAVLAVAVAFGFAGTAYADPEYLTVSAFQNFYNNDYQLNMINFQTAIDWANALGANLSGEQNDQLATDAFNAAGLVLKEDVLGLQDLLANPLSLTAVGTGAATYSTSTRVLNIPTPVIGKAVEGTTVRTGAFRIYKNATVSSGTAVFHLTADATSGGTALCPNGLIADSIDVEVNDANASYQMGYALSNSNNTVTVTANRLTTANILTGILGQSQANGSVVRLVAECY